MNTLIFSYNSASQRDQRKELLDTYKRVIRLALASNSLQNGGIHEDRL
jgi:hypothetical protein